MLYEPNKGRDPFAEDFILPHHHRQLPLQHGRQRHHAQPLAIGILFYRHSRHDAVAQPRANHAFDRLDAAKLHHRRHRYPMGGKPAINQRPGPAACLKGDQRLGMERLRG